MDTVIQNKSNKLWDIYGISDNLYTITLTPKGERKTHDELLEEFREEINKLKCVLSYWLVRESKGTNHFHGMIQTKSPCKFFKLTKSNKCKLHAYIEEYKPHFNKTWSNYCVKTNPKTYIYKMALKEL